MSSVIRIVDASGPVPVGHPFEDELARHKGRYVVSYDPTTPPGGPMKLTTTDDPAKAQHFESNGAAMELWRAEYGTRPWDGKPNRPLSAFTITIVPVEKVMA